MKFSLPFAFLGLMILMIFKTSFASLSGCVISGLTIKLPFPPLTAEITQGYDGGFSHQGKYAIDFALAKGVPVLAVLPGKVIFASNAGPCGNAIIIDHGNGITSKYCHLQSFKVNQGDIVDQGTIIGYVDNTGWSNGDHLHFEMMKNGNSCRAENIEGCTVIQQGYTCTSNNNPKEPGTSPSPPPSPSNLSVSCENGQIKLSWNPVQDATAYQIRIDDVNDGQELKNCRDKSSSDICATIKATSYVFTSQPGHSYRWWIYAYRNWACSQAIMGTKFSGDMCQR